MVATLPANQQMDQRTFDSALDHLTYNEWLIRQTNEHPASYRVNTLWKTTGQKQGLLEGLDLEKMEAPELRLNLETPDLTHSANRANASCPHISGTA